MVWLLDSLQSGRYYIAFNKDKHLRKIKKGQVIHIHIQFIHIISISYGVINFGESFPERDAV